MVGLARECLWQSTLTSHESIQCCISQERNERFKHTHRHLDFRKSRSTSNQAADRRDMRAGNRMLASSPLSFDYTPKPFQHSTLNLLPPLCLLLLLLPGISSNGHPHATGLHWTIQPRLCNCQVPRYRSSCLCMAIVSWYRVSTWQAG